MGKRTKRRSIQAGVVLLAVLFTLVTVTVVLLSSVSATARQIDQNNLQAAEYQLKTAALAIRQRIDEIDDLVSWCTVDANSRTYLLSNAKNNTLRNDIYTKLSSRTNSPGIAPYIQRLLLSSTNGKLMMLGTATSQSAVVGLDQVLALPGICDEDGGTAWEEIVADPLLQVGVHISGIPVSTTIRGVNNTAYCYISVSVGLIADVVREFSLEDGSHLYWYMGGQIYRIDGSRLLPLEAGSEALSRQADSAGTLSGDTLLYKGTVDGSPCSFVACPLGAHGLYLAESVPVHSPLKQLPQLIQPIIFTLLAILLLGVVTALVLRRMIGAPIQALQRQMEQIGQGNFTTDPSIEWDHELGDVGRGINRLSENVTALMERRIEDEKQKQDLEFRMLQGQINPHFLYNTLNSIRWMASIQHADGIAEMVTALSRLLKSVSKGTERLVPLRRELELLGDYFIIQRYRYGGTITLETRCEVEDGVLDTCLIPRFTLQPLAENAIFHGIEPKGCAGRLELVIRPAEGGDLLVELSDDGLGMSREQMEEALRDPEEDGEAGPFRHVGLWNVHKRLRYSFGEGYGLSLESANSGGLKVCFRLPAGKGRDEI